MGTPTANTSRDIFDASKGYRSMRLQQGVPITDADINDAQDIQTWLRQRMQSFLIGAVLYNLTSQNSLRPLASLLVDPRREDADGGSLPSPFTTVDGWWPGSMRPYVFDVGDANDFSIMWGPAIVAGMYVDDYETRGTAAKYTDLNNKITDGTVSAVPGGTTFEDDSKDFTGTTGDLHLVGSSGTVGNGKDSPCRVRFITGAEAGNTYDISSVPSSNQLEVAGPYSSGGPSAGDTYIVLPNVLDFQSAADEIVWLCVWVEDIDEVEDPDLEEPTMLIETSHRLKVRYWMRVLRDGGTVPNSATIPDPQVLAPQSRENHVYWIPVANIQPDIGAPSIFPADIGFGGLPQGITTFASLFELKRFIDDKNASQDAAITAGDNAVTAAFGVADAALVAASHSDLQNRLDKGWIGTLPAIGGLGTGTLTITTTGDAYMAGTVQPTATGSVTGFAATTNYYVFWDTTLGDWDTTTDANDLADDDKLGLAWFTTDGGGLVSSVENGYIGRRVEKLDRDITVSLSSTGTRGSYTALRDVLSLARMLTTIGIPTPLTVDVLDVVDVPTAINSEGHFANFGIHFRGRGKASPVLTSGGFSTTSAGFRWSFTAFSLFNVSATATMSGWTFENLLFEYNGAPTNGTRSVIYALGGLGGVTFRGCFFDCAALFAGFGAGSGELPNVIYATGASANVDDLTIEGCEIQVANALVNIASSAVNGANNIRIRDNVFTQVLNIAIGATKAGFLLIQSDANHEHIYLSHNEVLAQGAFARLARGQHVFIHDNEITHRTDDVPNIHIGDVAFTSGTARRVFIHDNVIDHGVTSGSQAVIHIEGEDDLISQRSGIFIHDNYLEGSGEANAGSAGIRVEAVGTGSADDISGIVIGNNIITESRIAVDFVNEVNEAVMVGNILQAGEHAVKASADCQFFAFAGNILGLDISTGLGVGGRGILNIAGSFYALSGNVFFDDESSGELDHYFDPSVTPQYVGLAGNVGENVGGAPTQFLLTDAGMAGNAFALSSMELPIGSADIALVGNYITDSVITDNGTNNVVANNTFT